ncbi:hypothetical protein [Chamaesiphon sp.]|uniref:hypothetical protein n=1 Tax=Chamaesiphon sp. TaxID=2814140 RepID=UPI003593A4F2
MRQPLNLDCAFVYFSSLFVPWRTRYETGAGVPKKFGLLCAIVHLQKLNDRAYPL